MQADDPVVAIACADLHLSLRPPIARSGEPDWFAAMARPLVEIASIAIACNAKILCAGDIFDHWRSPPELINFALDLMPHMIAIPGQHDLPNHSLQEIDRSAYSTLVHAGRVRSLELDTEVWKSDAAHSDHTISVTGFPWGCNPMPFEEALDGNEDMETGENIDLRIALVHRYVCTSGHDYPGAPKESYVNKKMLVPLRGYDVVIFGDNHKGFHTQSGPPTLFNCGTMMRRKSDEIEYKPQVGLIHASGRVEPHYLDTSRDRIEKTTGAEGLGLQVEMEDLINELTDLQHSQLDFTETLRRLMDQRRVSDRVRREVMKAVDNE